MITNPFKRASRSNYSTPAERTIKILQSTLFPEGKPDSAYSYFKDCLADFYDEFAMLTFERKDLIAYGQYLNLLSIATKMKNYPFGTDPDKLRLRQDFDDKIYMFIEGMDKADFDKLFREQLYF